MNKFKRHLGWLQKFNFKSEDEEIFGRGMVIVVLSIILQVLL